MPYWKRAEQQVDCFGEEVRPGDILEQKELNPGNAPWQYFVCYDDGMGNIQVRDLNANNVCMCDLGRQGDVKRLGHITEVYKKLEAAGEWNDDDWAYYFDIKDPRAVRSYCHYGLDLQEPKELVASLARNNFPEGWNPDKLLELDSQISQPTTEPTK